MRDVVYLIAQDGPTTEELRYSLRSLVNLPHREVWMVGGKPEWVRNVNWVPYPDHRDGKWFSLMWKFSLLPALDTTPVVYCMGDDFFVTAPVDEVPSYYTTTLAERAKELFAARGPNSIYGAIYRDTLELLPKGARNHSLHVPQVVETAAVPVDQLARSSKRLGAASLVGNLQTLEPVKLVRDHKVTTPEQFKEWQESGSPFLSTNDRTFESSGAAAHLRALFPNPCEYEED